MARIIDRNPTVAAGSAVAVTPNDSADLALTSRGLYIGGAGAVRVLLDLDTVAVTFSGCVAGSVLPIRCVRVFSTGTTATNILALY